MEEEKKRFSGGRKYSNSDITVYWKPDACIHASYCYRELIEVFDPGRRPWIDVNCAPVDRIIDVVNMCPTEALSWKWNDGSKNDDISPEMTNHINFRRPELIENKETPAEPANVSVKIMIDGPIVVTGDFRLKYCDDEKDMKNNIVSLCRCGHSKKQPFCDGTHRIIGFKDD